MDNHLEINEALTLSFDGILPLSTGNMENVTDTNGKDYLSFYSENLLWNGGYNNPMINANINDTIRQVNQSGQPLNIDSVVADIKKQIVPHLAKNRWHLHFHHHSFLSILVSTLKTPKKDTLLCLEAESIALPQDCYNLLDTVGIANLWDAKALKQQLKEKKAKAMAFVINPYLKSQGRLLARDEMADLLMAVEKAGIPIIWDESSIGLGRMGTLFSHSHYQATPTIILYDGTLYDNRNIHFILIQNRFNKKLDPSSFALLPTDAPNLIMLRAILNEMATPEVLNQVTALGHRFTGKIRALEANTGNRFTLSGIGLCLFLDFKKEVIAQKYVAAMVKQGILCRTCPQCPHTVFIFPPLIISETDADTFIEATKAVFGVRA